MLIFVQDLWTLMPIAKNHIQGVSIAIVVTLPPLKKHSIHYPCSLWLCDKAKVLNLSLHPDVYLYYRSFVFCGKISHLGCVADCSLFTIVTSFYSSSILLLLFCIMITDFFSVQHLHPIDLNIPDYTVSYFCDFFHNIIPDFFIQHVTIEKKNSNEIKSSEIRSWYVTQFYFFSTRAKAQNWSVPAHWR